MGNPSWLWELMTEFGGKPAIAEKNRVYSYSELLAEIERAKGTLSRYSIKPGEVVMLVSEYSFSGLAVFLTLLENANIIVPVTTSVESEIEERATLSEANITIRLSSDGQTEVKQSGRTEEVQHQFIDELRRTGDSGLVLFSSGSTGKPKAMVHNLSRLLDTYKGKKGRDLSILVFLLFDHIGGLNTLFNALSMGAKLVLPSKRDPDHVCELIERHKVNVLPVSPTFLNLILIAEAQKSHDLSSLRMITYGTEPMPESLLVRCKAAFPRVKFLQTFGTSETGIMQTSSKSSTSTLFRIEDPNMEYKIVSGELWLRSKTQVLGYMNHSMESFTSDGWFRTGDLVEECEEGYLRIVGRDKEIINVGGKKVLPIEVESVLLMMPEVADCMIYGEPNAIVGQIVVADIVTTVETTSKDLKKAVLRFCREKLDPYKIPAKVNLVQSLRVGDRFKKIRRKS